MEHSEAPQARLLTLLTYDTTGANANTGTHADSGNQTDTGTHADTRDYPCKTEKSSSLTKY